MKRYTYRAEFGYKYFSNLHNLKLKSGERIVEFDAQERIVVIETEVRFRSRIRTR